jgi:anti-anti-sigma factor
MIVPMPSIINDRSDSKSGRSLFVTTTCRGGVLSIRPVGPNVSEREAMIITSEVTPMLQQLAKGLKGLVIDLEDVKGMTSFGLGMCIEMRNTAKTVGASTVLVGLTNELRELFRMMKVDRLFTIPAPTGRKAKPVSV